MAAYNSTCYGIGDSRKDGADKTSSGNRNSRAGFLKGQQAMRFVAHAANNIAYAEIWVNKDTTIAADDTFTFTVTADA